MDELERKDVYFSIFKNEISNQNDFLSLINYVCNYLTREKKKLEKPIRLLNSEQNFSLLNLFILTFEYILKNNRILSQKFGIDILKLLKEICLKFCIFLNQLDVEINIENFIENCDIQDILTNELIIEYLFNTCGLQFNKNSMNLSLNEDSLRIIKFFGSYIRNKLNYVPYSQFFNQKESSPLYFVIHIVEAIVFSFGTFFYYVLMENSEFRNKITQFFLNPSYKESQVFLIICDIIRHLFNLFIIFKIDNKIIELNRDLLKSIDFIHIICFLFFSLNSKLFIIENNNLIKIEHQLFTLLTDVRSKFISTTAVEPIKKVKKKNDISTIENKKKKQVQLNLFGKKIYYSDK